MTLSPGVDALYARGSVVKVCGIREPEHAEAAAVAGADMLGFIFAPARRQVTPDVARTCIQAARLVKPDILACGVFVNAPVDEMLATTNAAGLDLVQLSGNESPDLVAALPVPATKVLHPQPGMTVDDLVQMVRTYQAAEAVPVAFLLDAFSTKGAGGTGEKVDWRLAAAVNAQARTVLAGGLSPANVTEAIGVARPLGVDVSSGVEVDGRKSTERIQAFVLAARAAFTADQVTTLH